MTDYQFIVPLIDIVAEKHPLAAQKLYMGLDQLQSATSTEEYQQIGILIRDAWIEFTQKLFSKSLVPEGSEQPGPSDVKRMLEYIIGQWNNCPRTLLGISKTLYSLSIEIQHDRSAESISPKWAILNTASAMSLILDLDSQHERLADRRYYKCPVCGCIDLKCTKDREVDPIDGPLYEYELWQCSGCDWQHYIWLG